MIKKLTKEQKDLLPVYRDKWIGIGLSTEKADRSKAEQAASDAYKIAGLKPPKFIWAESPMSGVLVATILKHMHSQGDSVGSSVRDSVWDSVWGSVWDSVWDSVGSSVGSSVWDSVGSSVRGSVRNSVRDSVWDSVENSVWNSVRNSVWSSVWDSVGSSVGSSVWNSVRDSVWSSVRGSVRDSVWSSVRGSVRDSVRNSVGSSVWDSIYGQHDVSWLSFYNYYQEVLEIQECNKLEPLMRLAKDCGWWIPYKNIAVLQEKTSEVHLKEGTLHNETGPSVLYPDGFALYSLNGIIVSKEIVETPANKLDCQLVLKEKNAEIRREIVRKIGLERLLIDLKAKELDRWNEYQLLELDLQDGRKRPYLKMINPSIDTIHIEGVEPGIKTVKQALAWRNGLEEYYVEPIKLT